MTELLNFPDGTVQHAYITTDNANDDLQVAVLDGDYVLLDANENPVLRWDASATQWDFVSQDVVGVGSFATGKADIGTGVSSITDVGSIGANLNVVVTNGETIADDASITIEPAFAGGSIAFLMIYAETSNDSAIVTVVQDSATFQESNGNWANGDTDGNNCVFRDGSSNLVLKNRTGGSLDYSLMGFTLPNIV